MKSKTTRMAGLLGAAAMTCWAAGAAAQTPAVDAKASIRTTSYGVGHVLADDMTGVGFGAGYAQASEVLCDIAGRVVTVNGERSLYFGPDAMVPDGPNRPKNIDSDFFWRRVLDMGLVEKELRLPEPLGPSKDLRAMVRGFVAGYNKYLADTGVANLPDARCRGKDWVRPITERDVYLRAMHWNLYRGGGGLITQIAAASPDADKPVQSAAISELLAAEIERGEGSNMIALGAEATDNGQGMLFANPHWTWMGPDSWVEMQLTVPGKLNVIGMQTIGAPVIQTGFNQNVAWAGTSSFANRYTFYKLKLVPGSRTTYLYDGRPVKMTPRTVSVRARTADGRIETRKHTFWETREGIVIRDRERPWTDETAYAMQDVGYSFRWLSQQLRLNMSKSAEDLSEAGKAYMAIGWRNLSAADDKGDVFYGDRTAIPAVTDRLVAACGIEGESDRIVVLDGSRSACAWETVPNAPVPGIFSADQLPELHRRDYVLQSNDTHWMNNLRQPLEGYPPVMGKERTARQLRTRNALAKVEGRLTGADGYLGDKFSLNLLKTVTMNNRVFSADIWLDDVLRWCAGQTEASIAQACHAFKIWDRTDNIDSPGALLWRRFAEAVAAADRDGDLYVTPFDVKDPIRTPSGLKTADPRVMQALRSAIADLEGAKIPLDATLRNYQFAQKGERRIPIAGGSGGAGQYNLLGASWIPGQGLAAINNGSSFIMWMQFTPNGPMGESIMTFSQSPNAASPHYADQTEMWSEMRTKTMLFTEAQIAADPNLKVVDICSGRGC